MAKWAIWIIPAICHLIAPLDMPYGYYQLLRVLVFCACLYLASLELKHGTPWSWAFVAGALIYNPLVKLSLGRELWSFVNIATAIFFVAHFWQRRRDRTFISF